MGFDAPILDDDLEFSNLAKKAMDISGLIPEESSEVRKAFFLLLLSQVEFF